MKEKINKFKELPSIKYRLEELVLRKESLEKIKSTISEDNYISLNETYLKQIHELIQKRDGLQVEILSLKNEIEIDSKMLLSEIDLIEKEIQETQFLFEQKAINKKDFENKRNTLLEKIKVNRRLNSKNNTYVKELDFYNSSIYVVNSFKSNNNGRTLSYYTIIANHLAKSQTKLKVIGIGIFAITFILIIFIFLNSKNEPYVKILPESYSDLYLGMSIDDFHSKYSDRDYQEDYNRDGSLSVSFKLKKVTDYKILDKWYLEFKNGKLLYIKGYCNYTSDRDEVCNSANKIDEIVKSYKYKSIRENRTWDKFPNCIAYKVYSFELREKNMPSFYTITISNDLNASRWSRDPLSVLIGVDI